MTDFAIEWRAKGKTRLPEIARQLAIPLSEIARMLMPLVGRRVQSGQAAHGRFRPLGANPQTPGKGLWWVAPGLPQPSGFVAKPTSGPWVGWAGYKSYHAWLEARGVLGQPRRFTETGEAWDSFRYRILNARKVRLAFYGRHMYRAPPSGDGTPKWQRRVGGARFDGKGRTKRDGRYYSNSEVMFLASRDEAEPMLMPSRQEVAQVMQLYRANMQAQLVELSAQGAGALALNDRFTKLERRRTAAELQRR